MQIEHKYQMDNPSPSVYYSTYCKSLEVTFTERAGNEANIVTFSLTGREMDSFIDSMNRATKEIKEHRESMVDTD